MKQRWIKFSVGKYWNISNFASINQYKFSIACYEMGTVIFVPFYSIQRVFLFCRRKVLQRNRVMPHLGFVSRFIAVDMAIHPVFRLITIVLSNKKELTSLKYLAISMDAIITQIQQYHLEEFPLLLLIDGWKSWTRFSDKYLKWFNTAQYQLITLFLVIRRANKSVVWFQISTKKWNGFHWRSWPRVGSSYLGSQCREKASKAQPVLLQPPPSETLLQPRVFSLRNPLAFARFEKFWMDAKEEGTHWRGWQGWI